MEKLEMQLKNIPTDGDRLKETDSMGREKFWEDLGKEND
jgi:hypothetical protein